MFVSQDSMPTESSRLTPKYLNGMIERGELYSPVMKTVKRNCMHRPLCDGFRSPGTIRRVSHHDHNYRSPPRTCGRTVVAQTPGERGRLLLCGVSTCASVTSVSVSFFSCQGG